MNQQDPRLPTHDPAAPRAVVDPIIRIDNLVKTYADGFTALQGVSLDIERGEILALLGPNGAGKTTMIGVICGLISPSAGRATVDGYDVVAEYRAARAQIGLVPQELTTDAFETVWDTVTLSRGLFGLPPDPAHIERVLRALSLWDKRKNMLMTLSGGMKRRVMIAKALSHEPRILFLDEPTAGVDVELRKGMWAVVRDLREQGVTVILTTHYIEEAEEIADRVAVIQKGRILVVDDKATLMRRLGRKTLTVHLLEPVSALPDSLAQDGVSLSEDGTRIAYAYEAGSTEDGDDVDRMLRAMLDAGMRLRDVQTDQSSLEEIFVDLVKEPGA
ncbi:MAG: ABC transporter ATP-binding protein [Pseudomonadota bacterium]